MGLAVANSLAAVNNGARQVECTINGIGERAGNASLEEIVMALVTRQDLFVNKTSIKTKEIFRASHLVSKLTGFIVAPNKAIVGINAFRHEAGIHQDGVLKERTTYEIIRPQDVGYSGTHFVLGKHSGRHAFNERLKTLGFNLSTKELERAFVRFKRLADKKKEVFDEDLAAIIEDEIKIVPQIWQLHYLQVNSATDSAPLVNVRLKNKGKILQTISSGDGPVDACYKAIDKLTKIKGILLDYSLRAVTSGKDALGEVSVKIKARGREVVGRGASTDIIEAGAKAYVNAVNKLCQH